MWGWLAYIAYVCVLLFSQLKAHRKVCLHALETPSWRPRDKSCPLTRRRLWLWPTHLDHCTRCEYHTCAESHRQSRGHLILCFLLMHVLSGLTTYSTWLLLPLVACHWQTSGSPETRATSGSSKVAGAMPADSMCATDLWRPGGLWRRTCWVTSWGASGHGVRAGRGGRENRIGVT